MKDDTFRTMKEYREWENDKHDCSVGYIDEASGGHIGRHFFEIPTQPAEAVGVCNNCGATRLMSNLQTVAGWNNKKKGFKSWLTGSSAPEFGVKQ